MANKKVYVTILILLLKFEIIWGYWMPISDFQGRAKAQTKIEYLQIGV